MGHVSPSLFCDGSLPDEHPEKTDKAATAVTTDNIAFFIEPTLSINAAWQFRAMPHSLLSLYYINLFKKTIYYALFIIFINFGSFSQIVQFVFGSFSIQL